MNFLITGGAGFIGSAVVRQLINETSHNVVNLDCLTYAGNLESLSTVAESSRYSFVRRNILDRESLAQDFLTYQPDVVMHLAAESHVDRSIDGPRVFLDTNIIGTYNLLEVSRQYFSNLDEQRRSGFKFHHISTDEVYGDLHGSDDLFTEATSYSPSSPYSASKAASDHLVRAWQRTYGLPTIITNCSNNYGPYHFPEKFIPLVIIKALSGEQIPIYGDGSQIRDWLYVEDHADALIAAATSATIGSTYNIGGHNEKSNLSVVRSICSILEELAPGLKKANLDKYSDLISFVADRPGHDARYAIDARKIQAELGWAPSETFESGLRKTVQWYLENQAWWRRVIDGQYALERLGETA